jgi:uncharacterized protein RhaS with RHS repeats
VSYSFDEADRRTATTYPGATALTVRFDYSVTGEITAIRENGTAAALTGVSLATYTYDNLGRRTGITRGNGTTTTTAFDPVSRLSSVTQDLTGTAQDISIAGMTYNPASQVSSQTRSNDTARRLRHAPGMARLLTLERAL